METKLIRTLTLTKTWIGVCEKISNNFAFTQKQAEALLENKTARLIGELPFIAGCDEAERTSLTHLAVYLLAAESGRYVFDHCPADDKDIFNRLRLIMSFKGGDKSILAHGMSKLALQMICGYNRDREKDALSGEYNPLNSGAWDFETLKEQLLKTIIENPCLEIDEIMNSNDAIRDWWG